MRRGKECEEKICSYGVVLREGTLLLDIKYTDLIIRLSKAFKNGNSLDIILL